LGLYGLHSKILLVGAGLPFLQTVQKIANCKAAITQHQHAVDHIKKRTCRCWNVDFSKSY